MTAKPVLPGGGAGGQASGSIAGAPGTGSGSGGPAILVVAAAITLIGLFGLRRVAARHAVAVDPDSQRGG